MTKILDLKLKVLVRQDPENGWWEAQLLDFDIAAQGKSQRDVLHELQRMLVCDIGLNLEQGFHPYHRLRPAPDYFWQVFEQSEPAGPEAVLPRLTLGVDSSEFEIGNVEGEVRAAA